VELIGKGIITTGDSKTAFFFEEGYYACTSFSGK
jgi:hypothetical protein